MALTKVIGRGLGVQGDTVAGDDAALGFTSTEGLIITGQGSTNDITIKNDADVQVCAVPTGTDDLRFPDAAQLQLGTGGDFKLYHDGSNNIVLGNGSHPMAFYTNDVLRQTIDANGHITQPYQPAFLVTMSSNSAQFGTSGLIPSFDTEIFDQNSDFASNTFTAPVTGRYYLSCLLYGYYLDNDATYYFFSIQTSNRNYFKYLGGGQWDSDAIYHGVDIQLLVDMDANDTASISVGQNGGHSSSQILASNSFFSGHLVC